MTLRPEMRKGHNPHSQSMMGNGPVEEATDVDTDKSEREAYSSPSLSMTP